MTVMIEILEFKKDNDSQYEEFNKMMNEVM